MLHPRGRKLGRKFITPSLDTLDLFCRVWEVITSDTGQDWSMRRVADKALKISVSELSRRLSALEKILSQREGQSVCLIRRSSGSDLFRPTTFGRQFYRDARKLLDSFRELTHPGGKLVSEFRIGTTNWILLEVLGPSIASFRDAHPEIKLTFEEMEYKEILDGLNAETIDLGIGPDPGKGHAYPALEFERFGPKLGMYLVCPANDRFAREVASGVRHELRLDELSEETLFVLPHGVQPGLKNELPPVPVERQADRVTVPHYSTIMEFAAMGLGKGIVPGSTRRIQQLHREGLVHYIPIPELGVIGISFYKNRKSPLPHVLTEFMDLIKSNLHSQNFAVPWESIEPHLAFPDSIEQYQYCYYLSWSVHGSLEWRRTKIWWKKAKSGRIAGTAHDLDGPDAPREYPVDGRLDGRLLQWTARFCGSKNDDYLAAFNQLVVVPSKAAWRFATPPGEHFAFLGMRSGFDDRGMPVSGTLVLSCHCLSEPQSRDVIAMAHRRLLLNAHAAHTVADVHRPPPKSDPT